MKIIGIDEVNFSPTLAGDCVVCSLYNVGNKVEGVKDSKQLSAKSRFELFIELQRQTIYSIVPATPNQITNWGVFQARDAAIAASLTNLVMMMNDLGLDFDSIQIDGIWSRAKLQRLSDIVEAVSRATNNKTEGSGRLELGFVVEGILQGDEKVYEISAASIMARCYVDSLMRGFEHYYPEWGISYSHGALTDKEKQIMYDKGPSPYHRFGGRQRYAIRWWRSFLKERYDKYLKGGQ